jgi:hypothetical protein
MSDKIEKYCPNCETEIIGMPHHFTAKYCFFCGGKLIPYVEKPEPKEPWSSTATKTILKAIDDLRKYSNEEAEEREKKKKSIFKKERNFYKGVVSVGELKIIREIEDSCTLVSVMKEDEDQINPDRIIAQYSTENIAGGQSLWDDLNFIMLIPCPQEQKERRFKDFKIRDKSYSRNIDDIIYEGGYLYVK